MTLGLALAGTTACPAEPTSDGDTGNDGGTSSAPATSGSTPTPTVMTSGSPRPTSTSGMTMDDDTAADSSTGATFFGVDMGGGSGGVCDVFAQDCPEGDKCMPWAADGGQSWNSTTCSPVVDNPGQVGDPCTVEGSAVSGIDDCDVGTMCYNVSAETNTGTCFELCGGSENDPTCDEGLCAVYNDGNLPLCLQDCDPLLQDCNDQLCLASPSANGFVCILDSLPGSVGDYGAPCEFVNTCDPGYFCAISGIVAGCLNPSGCCAEFCDLSLPDPTSQCTGAPQGEECQPWYGMEVPPPGYENVGFCGIPN